MTDTEIDILIAEKVMGCINPREFDAYTDDDKPLFQVDPPNGPLRSEPYSPYGVKGKFGHQWHNFRPSTLIADAWRVAEEMARRGYRMELATRSPDGKLALVGFFRFGEPGGPGEQAAPRARAICLAALRALGVEVQP